MKRLHQAAIISKVLLLLQSLYTYARIGAFAKRMCGVHGWPLAIYITVRGARTKQKTSKTQQKNKPTALELQTLELQTLELQTSELQTLEVR